MNNIQKEYQRECDKSTLHRIDMLYNKMIWLAKDDKEISVLDMNDLYFNTILKSMRIKYGIRFNLWEKENRLRRVRKEYLMSNVRYASL